MSDSVRPHRWQPTRLPHPRDSLGKNTEVGYHFLLQCMKMKSESEVTQSWPTLSDPMDCSLPGSPILGIFQAGVLEWVAIAFSPRAAREYFSFVKRKKGKKKPLQPPSQDFQTSGSHCQSYQLILVVSAVFSHFLQQY